MPTYNLTNTKTGEQFTEMMSIAELDSFLLEHPEITQDVCMPAIGDAMRLGVVKPDKGFNEVLGGMKKYYDRADHSAEMARRPDKKKNTIEIR